MGTQRGWTTAPTLLQRVQVKLVPFFFLLLEREASFVGKNFNETPSFPEQLEKRSYKANLEACKPG